MMDEMQALVRLRDPDRYLASLFAPESKRHYLMALYAFHTELAHIAFAVSEPQLAEIRLQWWLDTLDGLYNHEPQAHPVARALGEAIRFCKIPKHALVNMAKAHQFDFYSNPMPNLKDLEGYLGETSGALIALAALILDPDAGRNCGAAAGLAGVAYGMAQVLNKLPHSLALKQCFIPSDILTRHGIQPLSLSDPELNPAVQMVLDETIQQAEKRLVELQALQSSISSAVAPAFLHAVLAEPYLAKAKSRGVTLLRQGAEIGQMRKQWLLWRCSRGRLF